MSHLHLKLNIVQSIADELLLRGLVTVCEHIYVLIKMISRITPVEAIGPCKLRPNTSRKYMYLYTGFGKQKNIGLILRFISAMRKTIAKTLLNFDKQFSS